MLECKTRGREIFLTHSHSPLSSQCLAESRGTQGCVGCCSVPRGAISALRVCPNRPRACMRPSSRVARKVLDWALSIYGAWQISCIFIRRAMHMQRARGFCPNTNGRLGSCFLSRCFSARQSWAEVFFTSPIVSLWFVPFIISVNTFKSSLIIHFHYQHNPNHQNNRI